MYAVIETGGKQYRVTEGDTIFIEKLDVDPGDTVTFDKVLSVTGGKTNRFGTPTLSGASVTAEILKNGKAKKILVYKMKPKKNYRRKQGHRQPYTQVKIGKISI